MTAHLTRAAIAWVCFIPFPVLNGAFRQFVLLPRLGDPTAHQISTAILAVPFFAFAYAAMRKQLAAADTRALLAVGALWVVLTLVFEFGLGLVAGKTWEIMFADYNLAAGRVWPLFLAWEAVTPFAIHKLKSTQLT